MRDLAVSRRGRLRLAVGLVAATAVVVAFVVTEVVPELTLPVGFVLGAILASTDPVAVTALARRLRLPRRLNTLVQAESLLNDATSLVLFTVAVGVVVDGGGVSWPSAVGRFFLLAGGGAVVGLVLAWLSGLFRARTEDATIQTAIALLTPYVASSSPSARCLGCHRGGRRRTRRRCTEPGDLRRSHQVADRMRSTAWSSSCSRAWSSASSGSSCHGRSALCRQSRVSSGGRLPCSLPCWSPASVGWPSRCRPRGFRALLNGESEHSGWRVVAVMSWAGTRGVVPLAAALSIPFTVDWGAPFPHRDLLLVVTTSTIVVTLVVQGLSLGPLVQRLGVLDDPARERHEEAMARGELAARWPRTGWLS